MIRLSSLGDVVLTLPVYKRLRAAYPDAHIAALVKEAFADVLKGESTINEVIPFEKDETLVSLIRKIRDLHFDSVLDLHANFRSRILSLFSGARQIVRYRKAAFMRRLFVGTRLGREELQQHTLDRYLEATDRLIFKPAIRLSKPPSKILLIQTAFLGDAVLTTPLAGALHERFPDSHISVLCTPEVRDVFERHPAVAEVILFDKRGKEKSLVAQWALVQKLKANKFDLAVIPHRSVKSALFAWIARIPRRVGFSASQGRLFLTDIVPFQWGVHDVDRNLALLNVFGVQNPSGELWLKPEPAALERVNERLREAGVSPKDKLVGVNPGSVWATKRWLPDGFAAVADHLIQDGAKVVFIGGPKDKDAMAQVLTFMKEKPINWVGETTLKELIATVSRCQAFLTNDSGPLHIAVASQIPTVAIFGPTTKELGFFPYGLGHTVIEKDLDCRPCGLHGADQCPLGHFHCMKYITPDEVYAAVKEKLR